MRLFYIGFNLYNQISSSKEPIISVFTETEYKSADDIILGHTYIVVQKHNHLEFVGGINHNLNIKERNSIKKIVSSDNITFILYSNGIISKIDTAQAEENDVSNFLNVEDPYDGKDYIVKIACGSRINVAASNNNRVFNIPNKLEFKGRRIKQISVGHEHCLILDSNGDIYSFGCGIRGQLGHGTLESETNPKLIEALAGVKISKIATGGWHSCAVSVTGDLYTWGWNSNGQLGLPRAQNVSVFATPQLVCMDDPDCNVEDVACGSKHTVILIGTQLHGAGWNKYKQIGSITNENVYQFKLIKDFYNEKIISIKCGSWCTGVITQ